MKFDFEHDGYSTYTFRAYETEYDPVDSSYDREGVHIYKLATLFPSHFDIDEDSRHEQYRAALEA